MKLFTNALRKVLFKSDVFLMQLQFIFYPNDIIYDYDRSYISCILKLCDGIFMTPLFMFRKIFVDGNIYAYISDCK